MIITTDQKSRAFRVVWCNSNFHTHSQTPKQLPELSFGGLRLATYSSSLSPPLVRLLLYGSLPYHHSLLYPPLPPFPRFLMFAEDSGRFRNSREHSCALRRQYGAINVNTKVSRVRTFNKSNSRTTREVTVGLNLIQP